MGAFHCAVHVGELHLGVVVIFLVIGDLFSAILKKFLINMVVIATCLRKYMSTEEPLTVAYVKFSIGFRKRGSLIPVKPGCKHLEVRTMMMVMVMLMMVNGDDNRRS